MKRALLYGRGHVPKRAKVFCFFFSKKKAFFFEKKKQKTFATWVWGHAGLWCYVVQSRRREIENFVRARRLFMVPPIFRGVLTGCDG
jgi:hypothetical protein